MTTPLHFVAALEMAHPAPVLDPTSGLELWKVPRIFQSRTVAILCGGPSLTQEQVDLVRAHGCGIVAINRAYELAPDADVLWACDVGRFWVWCSGPNRINQGKPDAIDFRGIKVTLTSPSLPGHMVAMLPALAANGVKILHHRGEGWHVGLEEENGRVRGNNALFQVLSSFIHHTGATKVILLGADMRPGHWHQPWPMAEPGYECWREEPPARIVQAWGLNDSDLLPLGWYENVRQARHVGSLFERHMADPTKMPFPEFDHFMLPNFATLEWPLYVKGVRVWQCSPGSALQCFAEAPLEEVLGRP